MGRGLNAPAKSLLVMHTVYLLLGGNQGPVLKVFSDALQMIRAELGPIRRISRVYWSEPWQMPHSTASFYNQAVCLQTPLDPQRIMERVMAIESLLGRERTPGPARDRTIDIDILMVDQLVVRQEKLQLPHPRMHLRRFALLPLQEIAAHVVHPVLRVTVDALLAACPDQSKAGLINSEKERIADL